jgi:hypothetical protein
MALLELLLAAVVAGQPLVPLVVPVQTVVPEPMEPFI